MKLFYKPAACSLAPHIIAREIGQEVTLDKVDFAAQKAADGRDYGLINAKGYVPVLELDDGEFLTEAGVIIQFLADSRPEAKLLPPPGTRERYRALEWLNYLATELHKSFTPIFSADLPEELKQLSRVNLAKKFGWLAGKLEGRDYLMGSEFSAPDAYLFTILGWSRTAKVDLAPFPALLAYRKRVGARPAVQAAMRAEGLMG